MPALGMLPYGLLFLFVWSFAKAWWDDTSLPANHPCNPRRRR